MSAVQIPDTGLPGTGERLIDNSFRATSGLSRWMLNINRAVRFLETGTNSNGTSADQAEADAQTAITNAAAAQATANAALPKAGGTMTGPIVYTPYTVATLPATPGNYAEAWISDGSTAYPTGAGGAPIGGGAHKRKVYFDGAWLLF